MKESLDHLQKIEEADIGIGTHTMLLPDSVGHTYTTVWYLFYLYTGEKYLKYDHLVQWLQNTYTNARPGEGKVLLHLIEVLTSNEVEKKPFVERTDAEFVTKMKAAGLDINGSVIIIPTQQNSPPVFAATLFSSEDMYIVQYQFLRWLTIKRNLSPPEEAKVIQDLLDVLTIEYIPNE